MKYTEAEMKGKNIYELLPQDKFDNKNIEKLKMLEDKEIKLLIPTFTKEPKEEFREILYKIKNMEVVDEDTEDLEAESATYGICGTAVGILGGIPIHKFLFETLITSKWGDSWEFPFIQIGIIVAVLIFSVALAVAGPSRRIRKMSITDTIGSL